MDVGGTSASEYFQPFIVSAQGYEPFGGGLPGRVWDHKQGAPILRLLRLLESGESIVIDLDGGTTIITVPYDGLYTLQDYLDELVTELGSNSITATIVDDAIHILDWPAAAEITSAKDLAVLDVSSYRFAFNGMEKDDEMYGAVGNGYDFGARLYDPRVARWWSLDPLALKYPGHSPYAFGLNNPIYYLDLDGRDVGAGATIINKSSQPIVVRGDGKHVQKFADGTSIRVHGDTKNWYPKDLEEKGMIAGDDDIRREFTLNTGDSYRATNYTEKQADGSEITYYGGLIRRADGKIELTEVHDPDFINLTPGQEVILERNFVFDYDEEVSSSTHAKIGTDPNGSMITGGEIQFSVSGDAGDASPARITISDDTATGKPRIASTGVTQFNTNEK